MLADTQKCKWRPLNRKYIDLCTQKRFFLEIPKATTCFQGLTVQRNNYRHERISADARREDAVTASKPEVDLSLHINEIF